MENLIEKYPEGVFNVIVLGIVFDPKEKKILIGKRSKDPHIKELTWAFPGGKPKYDEELEEALIREVEEATNLQVANLGTVFAKTYPEKKDLLTIYYLCEKLSGEEKPGDDFTEIKWVNPEELENFFTTSFHPSLKEYILNLK
jgi:8-oxo-dGTP diphosphatase